MSSFHLRRLRRDDIPMVKHIVAKAFASPTIGEFVSQKMKDYCDSGCDLLDINAQPHQAIPVEYWVLSNGHAPLGLCGIYRLNWAWEKCFWIGWFAISPSFQKQGLGKATVINIASIARSKGGEVLKVETESTGGSVGFYEHLGFKREGTITKHYGPKSDAAILSLDLNYFRPEVPKFKLSIDYDI